MLKFKPKKIVYYRKERSVYSIEIGGLEDEEEARIVKNLIKDLSIDSRVFAEINGDVTAIDKKAINHVETDPKQRFRKKLEILPEKIENINILELQENMWTYFYFFCSCVDWKEFFEMKKVNFHFRQGNLIAVIYLRNMDGISVEIGENYSYYMDKLFRRLQEENYSIKKRF